MPKQRPEEVVELLSADMQYTLGCTAEWGDTDVIGYVLDSLPLGTRGLLQVYEAIEESVGSDYSFRFTRFGRKVARACFQKHQGYIGFMKAELVEAKARRDASKLPEHLQRTLAVLARADDRDAEMTLTLLPKADKQPLVDLGAIEVDESHGYVDVTLTDEGRQLVSACAFLQAPEWFRKSDQEFGAARRQYWEERFKNSRRSRFVTRPGDLHRKQ